MFPHKASSPRSVPERSFRRSLLWVLIGIAAACAGCNDPQAPVSTPTDGYRASYDPAQGELEFRLESPSGAVTDLRLVATELRFDAETHQVHASVAVRNAGDTDAVGPATIMVDDFTPRDVVPVNADCLLGDCLSCPAPCFFDHRDTYGEDGILAPGETSEPVEWILMNPSGGSFAFRARLVDPEPAGGTISGVVFDDRNGNGHRDDNEPGVPGATLVLRFGDREVRAETNARGLYRFEVAEAGLYEVHLRALPEGCEPTTARTLQVVILVLPDGTLSRFDRAHFGCRTTTPPPHGILVAGSVYLDINGNGQRDPGEAGVPGMLITGVAVQCPTFAPIEARTDERGRYTMRLPECVPPFVIHREPTQEFADTTPNPVVFEAPPAPGDVLVADFGVQRIGPLPELFIEGVVFLDHNRDGQRSSDEPGVEGVELSASGLLCATPVAATARTDANGHYSMRGEDVHCPLPWLVQWFGNWFATTPNPVILVQPPPDGSTFRVDFGIAPVDSVPVPLFPIEGIVFADWNRNGMRDRGEMGIAGAEIELLTPCDDLPRIARTGPDGRYRFDPDGTGCPVTGVFLRGSFAEHTTKNPVPVGDVFPGLAFIANFGVIPHDETP